MAVWAYFVAAQHGDRSRVVRVRLRVVLPALALAVLVVLGLGRIFPSYAVDRLAEEAAGYQEVGTWVSGGSSFELGDPEAASFQAQLLFVPIALFNVLFRPLAFEARNAMLAVSAVETTFCLVLVLMIAFRRRWRTAIASLLSDPELAFSLVLVLVTGVGVGLTTNNLGTLSRYRMPMMPFFALLLMVTAARPRAPVLRRRALRFPGPSPALLREATAGRSRGKGGA
jgi:hypothetical protein